MLALCLGRQLLNDVPWGCEQVELYKRMPNGQIKSTNIPVRASSRRPPRLPMRTVRSDAHPIPLPID